MPQKVIKSTTNYRLFTRSKENRCVNTKKHRALYRSMKKYGFLKCFPIVVVRDKAASKWVVIDGQHRLTFAEELGLPVHYVEADTYFDVAQINTCAEKWRIVDYAEKYAANGSEAYVEALALSERHHITCGVAAALLAGCSQFGSIRQKFQSGDFEVSDRDYAESVAGMYSRIVSLSSDCKNSRFLSACMAVSRVDDFDATRLIDGAKKCRDKLVSYSTRDAYLEMIEDIYNYNRRTLVPLKVLAMQVMKERQVSGTALVPGTASTERQ